MKIIAKKNDILWNYLGLIISMSSYLIWIPIVIYFLPADLIGVWYIFISIGMIVNLFDFGFSPQIARTVAYAWSGANELRKTGVMYASKQDKPNFKLLFVVFKTCKKLYSIISILALVLLATLGTIYIMKVTAVLDNNEIFLSWAIYIISIFYNLYVGYYVVALRGLGDIVEVNKSNISAKLIMILIGVVGLKFNYGLLSLSFATLDWSLLYLKYKHRFWFKPIVKGNTKLFPFITA